MFRNILIIYSNKGSSTHLESLKKVESILKKKQILFDSISINDFKKEFLLDKDLVISLGGDGNFIRVSHYLKEIFILGINSDFHTSEGFLCSLDNTQIERLSEILDGKYKINHRERINLILNGENVPEFALNEVYVGTNNQFHTSRYVVRYKQVKEEHRSSGVLVSTSTGSNGWYKSAKGSPFDSEEKKLKFLVREPFFSRLFSPKILEGEILEGEEIHFDSKRCFGGIVAIDSNLTYDFNEGDSIDLKISEDSLKVVDILG